MFKVKNNLDPNYVTQIFDTNPNVYNLRNADFKIPRFQPPHYGKHSLRYFVPYLWSKLELIDRGKSTVKSFRDSIKKKDLTLLIDNCQNCHLCY